MPEIFETSNIGRIKLKNRIVRSETADGFADENGRPTAKLIEFYKMLASSGAGARAKESSLLLTPLIKLSRN